MKHEPLIGANKDVTVPQELRGKREALFYILNQKATPVDPAPRPRVAQPVLMQGEHVPSPAPRRPAALSNKSSKSDFVTSQWQDHFSFKF
ncbi:hypothetical protein [Actibacterium sp. XHP0104]|uniref:hypothetical protein n=1 Tax=Actibacterium sp. XHP0104 TaxID=2984335 RepID=UPI0021E99FAC|nr:hypothetical protein [Actibacterium sp. XHP0104]MCV2881859.1 hypothetical protein [Actibacterium sp. XHP0104]